MTLRSFRRPLVLFLLPWLFTLLELLSLGYGAGVTGARTEESRFEPSPTGGCTINPWGICS